eukprot:s29_g16.t1
MTKGTQKVPLFHLWLAPKDVGRLTGSNQFEELVHLRFSRMLQFTVALPSAQSETFWLQQSSKVGDLKVLAQKSFQRGFLRLVTADHSVVDPALSLQAAGLEGGDHLTAIAVEAKLASTDHAFALFCRGGDQVITWGAPGFGGDSSQVQDQFKGVQQVQATLGAFAAIREDGSVVTWGDPYYGGDSSGLKGVQQVQACGSAFAAILADGSVVTWGDLDYGGDSSDVQDQLKSVQQVQANDGAFAAIRADGSVVTWGSLSNGGDSSQVQDQLKSVQQVQANGSAFAAILADGSVVTWGTKDFGGDSFEVQHWLKSVRQIQANDRAWLKGVQQVQACGSAFAAILADGSVVTWGDLDYGVDSSEVQDRLKGVQQVQASGRAFAAILADGSVVTWGDKDSGGDSSAVAGQFANATIVELLDQLEASLRRLANEDRDRLYRRMDRAVSSAFSPIVLGRMLAHLPSEEVHAIERWVVDEGALPSGAAARLFGALVGVQKAGGFLQDAVDDVKVGAEELWVRLSEEFASQPEEINDSWANWLKGRPPSPSTQSVLGDFDEDDAVSVISETRRQSAPAKALSVASLGRRSVVSAQLGGGYSSASTAPRKRHSCQLHCPASLFLFSDKSDKPSASAFLGEARRPSQQHIDFVMVDVKRPSIDKTQIEFDRPEPEGGQADNPVLPTFHGEVTDKEQAESKETSEEDLAGPTAPDDSAKPDG